MRTRLMFAGLLALGLAACQPPAGETPAGPPEATAPDNVFAPETVGTHTITGVLLEVRGEFPSYAVLIGAPEVGPHAGSTVQLDAPHPEAGGSVAPEAFDALLTKAVTVQYSSTAAFAIIDMLVNGTSVRLPVEGQAGPPADTLMIEGVLSGADAENGDLPSPLTVTAADGKSVTFVSFIEHGMARANGQTVTLQYVPVPILKLLSIAPAG
jgi:hypothetical protein